MDRELKEYLKWWGIIALAVVVLNMMGCASAPVHRVTAPLSGDYGAITTCGAGNSVIVIVNGNITDTALITSIKLHEEVHVRQMKPNCHVIQAIYTRSQHARLSMEAEAYCAQVLHEVRKGRPVDVNWLVFSLHRKYGEGMSYEEVKAKVPCANIPVAQTDGTFTRPP